MAGDDRRFWQMGKDDIDIWVERRGLAAWKAKVDADRAAAPEVLARGPNPWLRDQQNPQLQNVIANLAPELAARMRRDADASP